MSFGQFKIMQEDPMKWLKLLCFGMFQTKFGKLVLVLLLIVHGVVNLVQVYFFIFLPDKKQFVAYSPMCCGTILFMGVALMLLFKPELLNLNGVAMWDLSNADDETYNHLKKEIRVTLTITILTFVAATLTGTLYALPLAIDDEFFFAVKFCKEYFIENGHLLSVIYKFTFPLVAYVMAAIAQIVKYGTQHMRYQVMFWCGEYGGITEDITEEESNELFYDKKFQREVREKLIFLMLRSNELRNFANNKLKVVTVFIGGLGISICLLGISVVFFLIFFREVFFQDYLFFLRITMLCSVGGVSCAIAFKAGQDLEDETSNMFRSMCNVKWYLLDADNKRIYFLSLVNHTKTWRLEFLHYGINYNMGLATLRGIYSAGSVLLRSKSNSPEEP